MSKGWFTMKDVLKDLEKVTGKQVKNLDRKMAVSGEHPPPMHISEDDDIMDIYGELDCGDSNIEPDLAGITSMLRMVNDHDDDVTCTDYDNIEHLYKMANTVVSISKLNPNVEDFVPKSMLQTSNNLQNVEQNGGSSNFKHSPTNGPQKCSQKTASLNSHSSGVDFKEICETDFSNNETNNIEEIDINKKIDISNLNFEEIKLMREKLKHKIIDTSKANCLKKKRERNLAIASLLKLHTDTPTDLTINKPLKLMTPDYFQSAPNTCLNTESENIGNEDKDNSSTCQNSVIKNMAQCELLNGEINQTLDNVNTPSTQEKNDVTGSKIIDSGSNGKVFDNNLSKEIRDSVRKVDKWLNAPEKQKHRGSSIFLGPVTFKRKETAPVSPSAELSDRPSSVITSDSFVPSTYADELTRNYMERHKVKEAHEDIWTKLERDLKEKDKAIKEKSSKNCS